MRHNILDPFINYALSEILSDLYLGCEEPKLCDVLWCSVLYDQVLGSLKVYAHSVESFIPVWSIFWSVIKTWVPWCLWIAVSVLLILCHGRVSKRWELMVSVLNVRHWDFRPNIQCFWTLLCPMAHIGIPGIREVPSSSFRLLRMFVTRFWDWCVFLDKNVLCSPWGPGTLRSSGFGLLSARIPVMHSHTCQPEVLGKSCSEHEVWYG